MSETPAGEHSADYDRATEPLLLMTMRAHPGRLVEVVGDFGMKSGTTARGFVAEYDEAIRAAKEQAFHEGYVLGFKHAEDRTGYFAIAANPHTDRPIASAEGSDE